MVAKARTIQWSAAGLLAGATLLLLLVSFIPWHSWQIGDDYRGSSGAWGFHERAGDLGHNTESWFGDWEDDGETRDGIVALRIGAILLTLGTIGAATATVFILLDQGWRAGIVAAGAAVTAVVATALIGYGSMEWANIHIDRSFGYFLGITASIAAVGGALLAFLPTPGLKIKESLQAWAKADD